MIEISSPGPLTVIQDLGRPGYEHLGISRGGAIDLRSAVRANRLAGNEPGCALLESLLRGPVFRVLEAVTIGVAGVSGVLVNGKRVSDQGAPLRLNAGDEVDCQQLLAARGYIAVHGGLDVPAVLGSRSTNLENGFGGWQGQKLQVGDQLGILPAASEFWMAPPPSRVPAGTQRIRVVAGPDIPDFGAEQFGGFMASPYTVSNQSNHVGIRLDGLAVSSRSEGDRVSAPMPVGAIQITPSGQPLILLPARGTVGGYPVIATVITPDVWLLGQALPGNTIHFEEIPFDQAVVIGRQAMEELGL